MKGFLWVLQVFILLQWELWHQLTKKISLSLELVEIFKQLIILMTLNCLLTSSKPAALERISTDVVQLFVNVCRYACSGRQSCACIEMSPDRYLSLNPVRAALSLYRLEGIVLWSLSMLIPLQDHWFGLWVGAVAAGFHFQARARLKIKCYLSLEWDVGNTLHGKKKLSWVFISGLWHNMPRVLPVK